MTDKINSMIPSVTANDIVKHLTELFTAVIEKSVPFKSIPTPYLSGPPGVGKSQLVYEFAEELERASGRHVIVIVIHLLLFSPVDLRGVPVANADKSLAVWLKPSIFNMDQSPDVINLLFLDELSAAPQTMQAAAYQLCLDRRVGEHCLPDNCIVMAAGNRTVDGSVSYKMPKALANRLMHFEVQSDFASWKKWAVEHGIDARVIGFLSFDNSALLADCASSDLAYATPRSWQFVSNILSLMGDDNDITAMHSLIAGCIGNDTAIAFETYCKRQRKLPVTGDILKGVCTRYPDSQDMICTLNASILRAVADMGDKLSPEILSNVVEYAKRFPVDYAMTLFKDLGDLDNVRDCGFSRLPSLLEWVSKNRQFI